LSPFIPSLHDALPILAILPHDRTREQRQYERSENSFLTVWGSWMPPLLATLVLGLQLTFWENAIISTGEALDLLLFAYVIRCVRSEEHTSELQSRVDL